MGRAIYILSPFPFGKCYVLSCGVFLEKHVPYLPEEFISRKPSPFSVWVLWVCTKRHYKTGLPQPNVTWYTVFSEPATACPEQEWQNTEMHEPSLPFRALLSSAHLCCSAEWVSGAAGSPIRCPQEGNVPPAFSTLYDRSHAGQTTAESLVPFCRW